MDSGLNGRVAMISGATRGIGLAVARLLAAEGAKISICSRDQARLDEICQELADASGAEGLGFAGDLTDPSVVSSWVDATVERFGKIDILVNNASATRPAAVHQATPEIWDQALGLKLFGYAGLGAAAFAHMRRSGGGAIVNIIGTAAVQPTRSGGVRTVAATALAGWNKALANEGGAYNIRVNAVCPGHTHTHRWTEWLSEVAASGQDAAAAERSVLSDIPMGRIAQPEDVANAVAFLASDVLSGYVTGIMLNVDGGHVRGL